VVCFQIEDFFWGASAYGIFKKLFQGFLISEFQAFQCPLSPPQKVMTLKFSVLFLSSYSFLFSKFFSHPFVFLSSSLCFVDYPEIMTEFLPIMLVLWHKLSTLVQVWHWTFHPLLGANEVNSYVMGVGHHHLCCCWRSLNTHDCWWWVFSSFLGLGLHLSYSLTCCQMWNLYNFMIRSALHSIHVAINCKYGETLTSLFIMKETIVWFG